MVRLLRYRDRHCQNPICLTARISRKPLRRRRFDNPRAVVQAATHDRANARNGVVIVVALTGRSSWHKARRAADDLERWHRATERLKSMRAASPLSGDDHPATLWCKVLDRESANVQPYDQAREPSNT